MFGIYVGEHEYILHTNPCINAFQRYDLPFQEPDEKLKKAEDAVKKEHKV